MQRDVRRKLDLTSDADREEDDRKIGLELLLHKVGSSLLAPFLAAKSSFAAIPRLPNGVVNSSQRLVLEWLFSPLDPVDDDATASVDESDYHNEACTY